MEDLKYPVGKFQRSLEYNDKLRAEWIQILNELPSLLKNEVVDLSIAELSFHYRPDGWNIKQVVHHLADSHMNSLIRFKLGLTENNPTIKPYLEADWANLIDGNSDDINPSLSIIDGVHQRLVMMLKAMTENDFKRTFFHPESKREMSLEFALSLYAWHSRHHLAHIKNAKLFKNKF